MNSSGALLGAEGEGGHLATETRVQKQLIFGREQVTEPFLHPQRRLHAQSTPAKADTAWEPEPGDDALRQQSPGERGEA